MGEALYVMAPDEVAWGYLFGHGPPLPPPTDRSATPRQALERVVEEALRRPPCGVAFSGGRDSSLVLAVAVAVARREGLPEPVPITKVFPGVAATEEGAWQEQVVRHLELQAWERIPIGDELDLVGPLAAGHLREHGVIWPPTVHGDGPMVDRVAGGSLLDGEGGDELLGAAAHRIAPITAARYAPKRLRPASAARAIAALAPPRVRARAVRRRAAELPVPWLRPAALDGLVEALATDEAARPLSYATSVLEMPTRRAHAELARNRRILARRRDVELSSPLTSAEVVHALARDGGHLGRPTRTAALRAMAADLLPDAVLSRTSKATFTGVFLASHTRAFAAGWTGDGVDHARVDADELRRIWLSGPANALTSALLQTAWLAAH